MIEQALLFCVAMLLPLAAFADAIPVRHVEGLTHGFIIVRNAEGKRIGSGDFLETASADKVTTRLVLHFDDGSLYDDTTIFRQNRTFQLVTDHLIQNGPSFKQAMDVTTDLPSRKVTVRYKDKDGKDNTQSENMKLPADLANGLLFTLAKNIDPAATQTSLPMVIATPKPRLVQMIVTPDGESPFMVGNSPRKAIRYNVKIKLEGAAGVVAPLIGKQPQDIHIWVYGGEAPVTVKLEGALEDGGSIFQIEESSPTWPATVSDPPK